MKTDDKDRKILNALLDNSRLSYRQIAKKALVSVATVMNRIKRLEKGGVIKGYSALLNYENLGYDIDVIISIKVSKGKLFQVENKIATNPNVLSVFDVTGDFDAVVIAKFRNRRALDSFLKRVQAYDFVERTNTTLILNTIKTARMKL
ncbi:Lrp/AsnC family transcriptional regulator [Candidatus Woesearchaeota archaeon]|nr:Lrp/AsnC family transcriptional regulator [Candidatus Woesearchaeota archaeon]